MTFSQSIKLRLKALEFNLKCLNDSYAETQKDYITDSGLEYSKSYPYNSETIELFKKAEDIKESREENLFYHIFNFTQTFYSLKEYLTKEHPNKKVLIEHFFSNEKVNHLSRKEISNDLKHQPQEDLKYKFGKVNETTKIEGRTIKHEVFMNNSWFYKGIDSVEHCNLLYIQLKKFLGDKFQ